MFYLCADVVLRTVSVGFSSSSFTVRLSIDRSIDANFAFLSLLSNICNLQRS
jgi:hypothetical protein